MVCQDADDVLSSEVLHCIVFTCLAKKGCFRRWGQKWGEAGQTCTWMISIPRIGSGSCNNTSLYTPAWGVRVL